MTVWSAEEWGAIWEEFAHEETSINGAPSFEALYVSVCVCVCVCAIVIFSGAVLEFNLRRFIYPVRKYNRSEIICKLEQDWGMGSVKLLS